MEVSEAVKAAYQNNSIVKHVTISFPDSSVPDITLDRIYFETMKLYESVLENESLEFVGCIASKFSIQAYGVSDDIKGRYISVMVHTDGTEDEPITIFSGVVDSAVLAANKKYKEITAYDELYTKGETDIANWYKTQKFPMTLKEFRDGLFEYLSITQVECELPNDQMTVKKSYDPQSMKALGVIKSICQINGVWGIINRNGKFEYRFPPQSSAKNTEQIDFYKDVEHEEFVTKKIGEVIIRQSDNDEGGASNKESGDATKPKLKGARASSDSENGEDSGTSKYIIVGNMFTKDMKKDELDQVAENIYNTVKDFSYQPFDTDNNGLPWVECGVNYVSYSMLTDDSYEDYEDRTFFVLKREMTGIQTMRDRYSAEGEQYLSEFVTNIDAQIGMLEQKYEELAASKLVVYTYENKDGYKVGADEKTIIRIVYAASLDTVPVFVATVPLEMNADGNVVIRYYDNGLLLDNLTVTQYLPKGKSFVTLSNYFAIEKDTQKTLRVTAQTEIPEMTYRQMQADVLALKVFAQTGLTTQIEPDSAPPEATVAANTIHAALFGNGLATTTSWDGNLEIAETYTGFMVGGVKINKMTESLSAKKYTPNPAAITQDMDPIGIGGISIAGFTEGIEIENEEES